MDHYRMHIEQDQDGVFVACCADLPGCISQGRSEPEARVNLAEAIQGYLECLQKCAEEIPPPLVLGPGGRR